LDLRFGTPSPRERQQPERLLKSADLALYKQDRSAQSRPVLVRTEMGTELQAQIHLEKLIRDAMLQDRLELHHQPLFVSSDRGLNGYAALRASSSASRVSGKSAR
jgi:predicted signal transduction protein with EAL and GGDEF domain